MKKTWRWRSMRGDVARVVMEAPSLVAAALEAQRASAADISDLVL